MNPYYQLVTEYARLAREGADYPLGRFPRCPRPQAAADAPKALLFSPHPDDEVITGGLPLRLLRKSGWHVINVAVTQGSKRERQEERLAELKGCCDCVGFALEQTAPRGLERIQVKTRNEDPAHWSAAVRIIADILGRHSPRVIFLPHADDWNSTHVGTHHLVMDALKTMRAEFKCHAVETEYWRPMESPNLMVELSIQEVSDLVTALTFHAGELKRNGYHLSLPAWMVDNARRGSELVGGQGAASPGYTFATLYRLSKWANGSLQPSIAGGRFLSSKENPAGVFTLPS